MRFRQRLLTVGWSGVLVALATVTALAAAEPRPHLTVVEQGPDGVSLQVRIPGSAVQVKAEADGTRRIDVDGLSRARRAGHPELPALTVSIGLPDHAVIDVTVEAAPETRLPGPPLKPVSIPDPLEGFSAWTPEETPYRGEAPWPASHVVVEEGRFRDLRFARLLVYPARYDAATGEIMLVRSFDVRVDFSGGAGFHSRSGRGSVAEERLLRTLVNRQSLEQATKPAPRPPKRAPVPTTRSAATAGPAAKIRTAASGVVRVTRSELDVAGFDSSGTDPRHLQLSYRGTPVPCRVQGEGDGSFDLGDFVEFYGVPNTSRYSAENVYWLEDTGALGLRYTTRDATPAAAPIQPRFTHTERYEGGNSVYSYGAPAVEGDPHFFWVWFEDNPNPPRVTSFTHSPVLDGFDASGATARVRALFSGRTSLTGAPDHRVRFFVNGTEAGTTEWDGLALHTAEIDFDPILLTSGSNAFRFDYDPVAIVDKYFMDWFEIDYPRLTVAQSDRLTIVGEGAGPAGYQVGNLAAVGDPLLLDVTDPFAPVQLTGFSVGGTGPFTLTFEDASPAGRKFHVVADSGRLSAAAIQLDVASTLRDPANGADQIIVVPEGWEATLQPLVAHRQAEGKRVVLASLTDVVDEFAGGNVDDVALRDFVAYAYDTWQAPAVSDLLLVGEPNLDPRNYLGQSPFYSLMPIHFGVTSALGETMTDTWFGAVAGGDLLPDVAVGRISVRSTTAAADVVAKIIDYETNTQVDDLWAETVMLVASNDELFEINLETAALSVPSHFTIDQQYRRQGANASSINAGINSGAVLASFLGHGNYNLWADSPGGAFYFNSDVNALANSGRLSFVTALNCLNGLIGHPTAIDSMGEAFLNLPTTGAIGLWSSSGLGFLGELTDLKTTFFENIFEEHVSHFGESTNSSLVETYLTHPVSIDLITEMIFLGDPGGWLAIDSDDDSVFDRDEVIQGTGAGDRDSDDDGLLDGAEGGLSADTDGDGLVNALDPDADNDGLPDGLEAGVATPDPDTDLARGNFVFDLDPLSTTDPRNADTDGGGAPDGAEDRNADGAVDGVETDPLIGADDPACAGGPPPEVAAVAGEFVELTRSGSNVVLDWGDAGGSDPCLLYRVYAAGGLDHQTGKADFTLLAVTGDTSWTHIAGVLSAEPRRYVVVGTSLAAGEGPWGHYEP